MITPSESAVWAVGAASWSEEGGDCEGVSLVVNATTIMVDAHGARFLATLLLLAADNAERAQAKADGGAV